MLTHELLKLPNQYHCFWTAIGNKTIWILNNNGKEYKNIDWKNMDLYTLINDLSQHDAKGLSSFIEYCINNNQ